MEVASRPVDCIPGDTTPGTYSPVGWVVSRAGMDSAVKRNSLTYAVKRIQFFGQTSPAYSDAVPTELHRPR
jgi:hypothetical protein